MAVAVRLVEVLTLVTLLGIFTGFSIFIVFAERILSLSLFFLGPITSLCGMVLYNAERMLLFTLMSILHLTNSLSVDVDCCTT